MRIWTKYLLKGLTVAILTCSGMIIGDFSKPQMLGIIFIVAAYSITQLD